MTALPALQYARPIDAGSGFLLDQSQRPPGRKLSPNGSTRHLEDGENSPASLLPVSLSPEPVDIPSSAVSLSRQETLARLTGMGQTSGYRPIIKALPKAPSDEDRAQVPRIRVSKHRRSRSEHTLTAAKLDIPPADHGAPRSRSVHDLRHETQPSDTSRPHDAASDDSDDVSEDEHSSMWWKSLGHLSPQPFVR